MTSLPQKPPRALKAEKEPSEILMTVIRALSTSDSNEQREDERIKLEKDFKKSDRKLDALIVKHKSDLLQVMEIFDSVTTNVHIVKKSLENIDVNISEAKHLFDSDLAEIERLHAESAEYEHTIQILHEIETISKIPQKLNECLAAKNYLTATLLLTDTIFDKQSEFDGVFGLRELNEDLSVKKTALQLQLFKDLNHLLYNQTIDSVNDNDRQSDFSKCEISKSEFDAMIASADTYEPKNATYYLAIIVKSIALMNQTTSVIEFLKTNMQSELFQVLNDIVRVRLDLSNGSAADGDKHNCKSFANNDESFLKTIEMIFESFKVVAYRHELLMRFFQFVSDKQTPIYDLNCFWHNVQIVIIELLKDCLDMDNSKDVSENEAIAKDVGDLSKYFLRKLPVTKKKMNFFRFDVSTNVSSNSCRTTISLVLSSQKDKFGNILIVFKPLTLFLDDTLKLFKASLIKVHEFIHSFVTGNYLKRLFFKFHKEIDEATRSKNAWKNITILNRDKNSKPLIQSAVVMHKCLNECETLIKTLATFKNHIISLIINLVQEYYDICYAKYCQLVQQHGGYGANTEANKLVYSAYWITDQDVSRYLKSLRGWQVLKQNDSDEQSQNEISEANLLMGNLAEYEIHAHDILSDIALIKELACIHESMEWLVFYLKSFSLRLDPQKILETINSKFEQFSDLCILVLHLELRVQCFYYISVKNVLINKEALEPDQKIIEFKRFLIRLDETMSFCLNGAKFRYVFDGLGDLMAKIIINLAQFLPVVDELTIQQMHRNIFELQRALNNITFSNESALDTANEFYELLYLNEDEILNELNTIGREFSDLEYTIVFQLLSRTKKEPTEKLNLKLSKLSEVLKNAKKSMTLS